MSRPVTEPCVLRRAAWLLAVPLGCATATGNGAFARPYHVDAVAGDDRNDARTPGTAWRTLSRVNAARLRAGDEVLLASGSVWTEPLTIRRSGRRNRPILVRPSGAGARPRIDAGGVSEHGVAVLNAEYVELSGLEVTNDGPPGPARIGVLISAENSGVARGIAVRDFYIHDVRGTNDRKDNGGIVFRALGPKLRTRFEGITIERNIIRRVDRSGIAGISDQVTKANWFPSRNVIIRDNHLDDIGGDGIVPRGTDGALVEHNIVYRAAMRAPGYNVAIWQWSTDNTLIQLNEAAFTNGRWDGQGFDSDFNSRGTTIAFNYSHDNDGGFVLICSPAPDASSNIGNIGTVVRDNVSRNDGARIFQLSGQIRDVSIERNVIHVPAGRDVQMVAATEWQGWASDVRFTGNLLAVAGTARYGHEVGRDGPDYVLGAGFPVTGPVRFESNMFLGSHVEPPEDASGTVEPDHVPAEADWAVPTFDPAQPESFSSYLAEHRRWMLGMLTRELGRPVTLLSPRPASALSAR